MKTRIDFKNKIENKTGFIELKNMQNNSMELDFFGDIASEEWMKFSTEDRCPSDVIDLLNSIGSKDLAININSCGGSVFGGISIYNLIKQKCTGNIIVNIQGQAASIASVIAMAGQEINMGIGTQLMVHKPSCGACGNADDLQQTITLLDKCQESILDIYMQNVNDGVTRDQVENLVNESNYLSVQQCQDLFKNVKLLSNKIPTNKTSNKEVNEPTNTDKEPLIEPNTDELEKEELKKVEIDNELKELSIFLCEKL